MKLRHWDLEVIGDLPGDQPDMVQQIMDELEKSDRVISLRFCPESDELTLHLDVLGVGASDAGTCAAVIDGLNRRLANAELPQIWTYRTYEAVPITLEAVA